jgi:hypothetical protein
MVKFMKFYRRFIFVKLEHNAYPKFKLIAHNVDKIPANQPFS